MADFTNITRRQAFKVLPAIATAAAVPAVALAAPEAAIMDPAAIMEFHAREFFKLATARGKDLLVTMARRDDGTAACAITWLTEDMESDEVRIFDID